MSTWFPPLPGDQPNEPPDSFPQTEDAARICVHANRVWFGHECGLCDSDLGRHVFQDEVGPSRWVFIERESGEPGRGPDVYVGPFYGENAEAEAVTCMNESLLVDHLLQREGGGGTDCYVTVNQPDNERDDVHIIDQDDPDHTGKPNR